MLIGTSIGYKTTVWCLAEQPKNNSCLMLRFLMLSAKRLWLAWTT